MIFLSNFKLINKNKILHSTNTIRILIVNYKIVFNFKFLTGQIYQRYT